MSRANGTSIKSDLLMVSDEEYQKHAVFADLERFSAFYKNLSVSVFPFVSVGTRAIGNIDSYIFSSIQGTLQSIPGDSWRWKDQRCVRFAAEILRLGNHQPLYRSLPRR